MSSSPAADGDLADGIVSVSLAHTGSSGVVLSCQVDPDLCGMDHLLQGKTVVEVVVARPPVWLGSQQVECDVAAWEGDVAAMQKVWKYINTYRERKNELFQSKCLTNAYC